ncbi:MAG: nicotinamide riboside transporter PnuC [Clostridia bacterium]|nr:nicotinamide riboside transporter PnuC [Clostridia bacterium]
MKKYLNYFTKFEKALWAFSALIITACFLALDRSNYLSLVASLIGVTFLIFNAKGNPIGQFLTIVFSVLYGFISYSFAYYGEMVTYLGMTAPMALLALISWLRNPYKGNKAQVKVNRITKKEVVFMLLLTAVVTVAFYFILSKLNTANIIPSTLSVTTSFLAVYLTFRRSPYFALAYASNDLVLIVLWAIASLSDKSYVSVLVCFVVFFVNDMYGFINWKRMEKHQAE